MEIKKEAATANKETREGLASLSRTEYPSSAKADFLSWMESEGYIIRGSNGKLKFNTNWSNKEDRIRSVRKLVEVMDISPLDLKNEDFFKMGLMDLLKAYSIKRHSFPAVFNALKEAYPELKVNLWDIRSLKGTISKNRETAAEAIKWLAKKKSGAVTEDDFENNGVGFALSFYSNAFDAIVFAQPDFIECNSLKALSAKYLDKEFVNNTAKRRAAISMLIKIFGSPKSVNYQSFELYGMESILSYYSQSYIFPNGSKKPEEERKLLTWLAVSDVIKDFKIWEMKDPPKSLFLDKKTRIESTIWLSSVSHKNPYLLSYEDWESFGIEWIVKEFYYGDHHEAIHEAMDSS